MHLMKEKVFLDQEPSQLILAKSYLKHLVWLKAILFLWIFHLLQHDVENEIQIEKRPYLRQFGEWSCSST